MTVTARRRVAWVGGLFALGVAATAVAYLLTERKLRHTYETAASGITPATDSATVARGGYLAQDLDCNGCHGDDYAGTVSFEAFGVGRVVAPNLTSEDLTNEQWERAIRFGVNRAGRGMIGMPSRSYYFLGDADLAALVGYFKSLNPVRHALPDTKLGPLGRFGLVLGWFDVEPELVNRSMLLEDGKNGSPEAYGTYVGMTNCADCHGTGRGSIANGASHGRPPAEYSDDQLFQFLRAAARAWHWIHRFTEVGGWR